MIQLKNVSKFYYSKGIIASGITKVNLELGVGEFVVITGESGSGKSTLLNVISGLDTYEEGEMYVEGRETSHFSTAEFETYRKKYIGNIFQEFNLVNSYTVYQNIELILWINGVPDTEVKRRVPEIIDKVGLTEYSRTKVSKLSGGQKQRVSIARALAKDTSIIVADEPTGNLDSESAEEVIKLLSEIAKDKLVVVVTHNFDQFEKYATRVVRMNDGRVIEDKKVVHVPDAGELAESESGKITVGNKLKLGVRNTFNIIPKFLLLLIVFLFVTISVTSIYTNFKESENATSEFGFNQFFTNYSDDRMVVKHRDNHKFTDEEIKKIEAFENVRVVAKDDILIDKSAYIEDDLLSFYGYVYPADALVGKLNAGEMPKGDKDAVIRTGREDGILMGEPEEVIGTTSDLMSEDGESSLAKVKITGIQFYEGEEFSEESKIYVSEGALKNLRANAYAQASTIKIKSGKKTVKVGQDYEATYRLIPTKKAPKGKVYVPAEFNENYKSEKAKDQKLKITADNMYFDSSKELKIKDVTGSKMYNKTIGIGEFEEHAQDIFINPADFRSIFDKGVYQISVFATNNHEVAEVTNQLREMDMKVIPLKDSISPILDAGTDILSLVQVPLLVILVVVIFFIAYFVTRLILKSRDSYFSIARMLGMSQKDIKRILDIEILLVVTIAFGLFFLFTRLVAFDVLQIEYVKYLIEYMEAKDYIILYLVLVVMAYMISGRAARKLFMTSAMQAYRGEA